MELKTLRGVGEKTLYVLNDNGIYTVDDLLLSFPKNYVVYEIDNSIAFSGDLCSVNAQVVTRPIFMKYRRSVNTVIFYAMINNVKVKCIIFSGEYLRYKLKVGMNVVLFGRYKAINYEFTVRSIFFEEFKFRIDTEYRYKGIPDSSVSRYIKSALGLNPVLNESLPEAYLSKYKLLDIHSYITKSHFPIYKNDYIEVMRRRKYEEFFWYSISLELLKLTRTNVFKAVRDVDRIYLNDFIKSLPYELSEGQNKAVEEVIDDIGRISPMNRLVQGDVGCGKSIVAFIACLAEIKAGFQTAIMVPTEILANQQYENFKKLLEPLGFSIALLTSSKTSKEKEDIRYRLLAGRMDMIIGTHALLEDNILFRKLGLVVIDEQHRFGVVQRQKLVNKYKDVDCLYLTATPIPRTLGLTSFGDLDISSITTMPSGRKKVETMLVPEEKMEKMILYLNESIKRKEQVYVVVPLVLENEDLDCYDVDSAYELITRLLPDARVKVVHGKQKALERNTIMSDFKAGKIDILISTTVIEVGVDVKNATNMVILNAERFGLAQIHQLRGRVGRSDKQSYCYLESKDITNPRLQILKRCSDGFEISVEDFKLRGPGDYLGDEQSGHNTLEYTDFEEDYKIWVCAKADAKEYVLKTISERKLSKELSLLKETYEKQKGKLN